VAFCPSTALFLSVRELILPGAMDAMLASLTEPLSIAVNVIIICPGAECNWRSQIDCDVAKAIVALSGFHPWYEGHSFASQTGCRASRLWGELSRESGGVLRRRQGPESDGASAVSVEGHFAEWPNQRPPSLTPFALQSPGISRSQCVFGSTHLARRILSLTGRYERAQSD
jgi:hypothetical protein